MTQNVKRTTVTVLVVFQQYLGIIAKSTKKRASLFECSLKFQRNYAEKIPLSVLLSVFSNFPEFSF